jgi:lipopolysaccharide export system protein LptC
VREAQVSPTGLTTPRIEFRGEFLHAYLKADRVVSNRTVEIRRGKDLFLADTMDFDNERQTMVMQGRVKGTLVPPSAR